MLQNQAQLGPTISSNSEKNENDYIIEFSGIDGDTSNDLKGIFITVSQISNIKNEPIFYGIIIYDPTAGIVNLDQISNEELYTYLGRMTYNGNSRFFLDSTEMTLRLTSQYERDALVRGLFPSANQEEVEQISDELLKNLFPINDAMSLPGWARGFPDVRPGPGPTPLTTQDILQWERTFTRPPGSVTMKELREVGRRVLAEQAEKTAQRLEAEAAAALARSEALAAAKLVIARLSLITMAIDLTILTVQARCAFVDYILTNMQEPRIPTIQDLPSELQCGLRLDQCRYYWHPDGRPIQRDPQTGIIFRERWLPSMDVNAMRERCQNDYNSCLDSKIDDMFREDQRIHEQHELEKLIGQCPRVEY